MVWRQILQFLKKEQIRPEISSEWVKNCFCMHIRSDNMQKTVLLLDCRPRDVSYALPNFATLRCKLVDKELNLLFCSHRYFFRYSLQLLRTFHYLHLSETAEHVYSTYNPIFSHHLIPSPFCSIPHFSATPHHVHPTSPHRYTSSMHEFPTASLHRFTSTCTCISDESEAPHRFTSKMHNHRCK